MPRVNPEIVKWARTTSGLDLDEASASLGISAASGLTASDRLRAIESGEVEPTRSQLEKMAKKYRRPLLAFYLSDVPRTTERGTDFRTLPDERSEVDEAMLDALIRDVRARQNMVRSLIEEDEDEVALDFVGSAIMGDGVEGLVSQIRAALDFELGAFRAEQTPEAGLARLRAAVEDLGVFVLLIGDLGSYHTSIGVETFRGIALADEFAPFVVINDRDAHAAWSFTLVHELAHLWLGQSGVSGAWAELSVEKFCNDVASEFLLPAADFAVLDLPPNFDLSTYQRRISEFAGARNVSGSMVAYRLLRFGVISESQWTQLRDDFRERWTASVSEIRARNRESDGGPSYYVVRRHRTGVHMIEFVARMLDAGAVTTTKAGRILGVKASNVHTLIDTA